MTSQQQLDSFGNRVGLLRQEAGLTQQAFADMLGLARSSIANIERGSQEPGIGTIVLMARLLGVSCDVLLGAAEDSERNPLPWIDLVTQITASEREYRKLGDDCWAAFDVDSAIRYRGMADGLDMARKHQAAVLAEARAAK